MLLQNPSILLFFLFVMLIKMLRDPLGRLRLSGWLEGLSFLVLLGIAMPLKYFGGIPAATQMAGAVHGALFLAYVFSLIQTAIELRWSLRTVVLSFLASLVPFGTFYADRTLFRLAAEA